MIKMRLSDGATVQIGKPNDGFVPVTFPANPDRNGQYPFDGTSVEIDNERLEVR